MGEENIARENPMGKFGKRLKCLNCLSEKHFIKDCKKERKCYIWKKKGHLGNDCEENIYFKKKSIEEEGNKEKQSFYIMGEENRGNIEEGIIFPTQWKKKWVNEEMGDIEKLKGEYGALEGSKYILKDNPKG